MANTPAFIVTGGAGFIGANIVGALLDRRPRPRVVVVDSFRTGTFANLVEACDRRGAGGFDGELISESAGEVDWDSLIERVRPAAVIHQAAITDTTLADEREMLRENAEGFRPLLHACVRAGVPLTYASSAATYGRGPQPQATAVGDPTPPQAGDRVPFPLEAAGRPSNVYGFSKWLMEVEHRRLGAEHAARGEAEPRVVGLRYFNVFGPGEGSKGKMASMVYQLARQMLAGNRPRVFADGSQARDQVYVDDVVECTLSAAGASTGSALRPPRPGVYNVGSGVATTFNDVIAALRSALSIPERERPTEYFEMPASIRAFYQDYTCADLSANESGLGWRPRWKPTDAIRDYAAWLRSASPAHRLAPSPGYRSDTR